jgi:hypothetical protein
MPYRKNISRLALASLLAAAVSGPAAMAKPALDTSVSPVQKPTPGAQDKRSESAKEQSVAPQTKTAVSGDRRSPDAKDQTRAPRAQAPLPGPPTWPAYPRALTPPAQPATTGDGGDIDVEWPVAVLALAGTLLLGGGLAVAGYRLRVQARPAH